MAIKTDYSFWAILLLVLSIVSGTIAGVIAGIHYDLPWLGFATFSVFTIIGSVLVGSD